MWMSVISCKSDWFQERINWKASKLATFSFTQQDPKGHNCTVDRQNKGFKQTEWGSYKETNKTCEAYCRQTQKMTDRIGATRRDQHRVRRAVTALLIDRMKDGHRTGPIHSDQLKHHSSADRPGGGLSDRIEAIQKDQQWDKCITSVHRPGPYAWRASKLKVDITPNPNLLKSAQVRLSFHMHKSSNDRLKNSYLFVFIFRSGKSLVLPTMQVTSKT